MLNRAMLGARLQMLKARSREAYLPPSARLNFTAAHSMLVYLDSWPFLPLSTWEHWFELAPHVVGSWRVGALPGN